MKGYFTPSLCLILCQVDGTFMEEKDPPFIQACEGMALFMHNGGDRNIITI